MNLDAYRQLRCPDCSETELCSPADMLSRLRVSGMLKRAKDPEPALVVELFESLAYSLGCSACSRWGLIVEVPPNDEFDWPESRSCEACGAGIPAERLELFPDSRRCAACQQKHESAPDEGEIEFCPRCGSPMTLRASSGSGLARYTMVCAECRR